MFFESKHMRSFGCTPALLNGSGSPVSYVELDSLAEVFAERLAQGRGLLALTPSNTVACIAAYLGALRRECPVVFATGAQLPFPCLYAYDGRTDILDIDRAGGGLELHADLALLLSTSGSTGAAKSVRLSHRNLDSNASSIAEYLRLDRNDRSPTNLPLHYSYGLSVLNSHLAAGGALLLTDRTVLDPCFWSEFKAAACTGFAGVPHTYDLIEKSAVSTGDLPALRYATQAGGKLAPERVARWAARAAQEKWDFVVMYGQTEASPRMAYLPPDLAQSHPDCIGRPIPHGRFTLQDEAGEVIVGPDQPGELIYEGPNVMMGYASEVADLARGHETRRLSTGDLAVRTRDDLYRIVGRLNRFIKPYGLRISLEEVEAHLANRGLQATCLGGANETLWVLIAEAADLDASAIRTDLERWLQIPAAGIEVRAVSAIPRRDNGKIDTSAASRMVADFESAGKKPAPPTDADAGDDASVQSRIRAAFRAQFGNSADDPAATYRSLGGDSLSYINLMLTLEEIVPDLPSHWDVVPIAELGRSVDRASDVPRIFADHFNEPHMDETASFMSSGGAASERRQMRRKLERVIERLPPDWPQLSIAALQNLAMESPKAGSRWSRRSYRPANLDTLRGLACLLVVALHVLGSRPDQGLQLARPSSWHAVMDALDLVRLPLFTAMTGYIYGAMPATREGFGTYMLTKLKQLALPTAFATLIYWLIKVYVLDDMGADLLYTYIHSYEHLWYIYALLFIFFVVSIVDVLLNPTVKMWLALSLVAMAAYAAIPESTINYLEAAVLLLPFFLFGIIVQRRSDWLAIPVVPIASAIVLVMSLATLPLGQPELLSADKSGIVVWAGGFGALVLLLLYFPKFAPLEAMAAYSFTIYLWHPAAGATMRTLLWKLGIKEIAVVFAACLAVGILVPIAMHLIASRLPGPLRLLATGK